MPFFDAASASGLPAPYWFVEFFKTLGFGLHAIPMGIWLVGVPFAALLWLFGGTNARRLGQRLFKQLPVVLAFGINLGIVPLLFVQLAYAKAFYPATILTAAHWLGALGLVLVAYYSAYLCSFGVEKGKRATTTLFALLATACLTGVGLIFSSAWTLVERPDVWLGLWSESGLTNGGATYGLGTYWRDATVYLRFASVFGLACYAVSFWIVFDAFVLYRGPKRLTEEEELALLEAEETAASADAPKRKRRPILPIRENPEKYRDWVVSVACVLAFFGLAIAAPALFDYYRKTIWSNVPPFAVLPSTLGTVCAWGTLVSLAFPFVFLILAKLKKIGGTTLAFCSTVCEVLTVGLFATTRQTIQNVRLAPYLDVRALDDPSAVQWSPILAFLGCFVLAVAIILYVVYLTSTADRPRTPKAPKAPKAPKTSKEPRTPKEPVAVKEPKAPKGAKAPKTPDEPNAANANELNFGGRPIRPLKRK